MVSEGEASNGFVNELKTHTHAHPRKICGNDVFFKENQQSWRNKGALHFKHVHFHSSIAVFASFIGKNKQHCDETI